MLPNITETPPTPSVASKAVEPAPEPMDMDTSEPSFGAAAELMRTSGSVSGKEQGALTVVTGTLVRWHSNGSRAG